MSILYKHRVLFTTRIQTCIFLRHKLTITPNKLSSHNNLLIQRLSPTTAPHYSHNISNTTVAANGGVLLVLEAWQVTSDFRLSLISLGRVTVLMATLPLTLSMVVSSSEPRYHHVTIGVGVPGVRAFESENSRERHKKQIWSNWIYYKINCVCGSIFLNTRVSLQSR